MLYNKKSGVSFTEILISTAALAVLMLGFSEFTAGMFDVSASHASQIISVNHARFSSERIITEINKAAYIYPAGVNIQLSGLTINTNNSVAILIEDNSGDYFFVAYYTSENGQGDFDLYEYTSDYSYTWDKDTSPAINLTSFNGSAEVIANKINIENTVLNYILNYNNAPYDEILKGEIGNASASDTNALIKGIDWEISQGTTDTQKIQIKGISRNVPRFFE